jgi:hypothetical protein
VSYPSVNKTQTKTLWAGVRESRREKLEGEKKINARNDGLGVCEVGAQLCGLGAGLGPPCRLRLCLDALQITLCAAQRVLGSIRTWFLTYEKVGFTLNVQIRQA